MSLELLAILNTQLFLELEIPQVCGSASISLSLNGGICKLAGRITTVGSIKSLVFCGALLFP